MFGKPVFEEIVWFGNYSLKKHNFWKRQHFRKKEKTLFWGSIDLSTKNENPYEAELLFSIDGFLPDNINNFERLIIIIDANDKILLEKYKKYYLDINKDFEDIVFYKSDDNGKWIEENFMRWKCL